MLDKVIAQLKGLKTLTASKARQLSKESNIPVATLKFWHTAFNS